ncbi:MAG: energy transducer TonB [Cytophagales bacterium]|nr:energy transducer TonB [Cytophagales bacterium]
MTDLLLKDSWVEIVFQGKDKAYGAYTNRKEYVQNINKALILACVLFSFFVALPLIMSKLDFGPKEEIENVSVNLELLPPPPVDPKTPPPPPPPKIEIQKVIASVKFLPPKVEEDEKVKDEDPPTQEELKDVQISSKTQEGEKTEVDVIQETGPAVVETKEEVFLVVEQMPEFPGGTAAMQKFIAQNIKYPKQAASLGIEGRVIVSFVINSEGKISTVEVLKGIGSGCDEEAIRVIQSMPGWTPGKQNGRPVSVKFTVPIKFTLN